MVESKPKSIIIFDDDQDILEVCTIILEEKGWVVNSFTDCDNIVEKVEKINPSVILLDNWIPSNGGIEAGRILKSTISVKQIPIVLFSANDNLAEIAQMAGADSYIEKPFDLNVLEQVLEKAIQ